MSRRYPFVLALVLGCGSRSALEVPPAEEVPPPDPEVCNGLDDDGDGEVDEDIPPLTCGEGACLATAPGCVDGVPGVCTPGAPMAETCNGIDDDCDGAIDEDLGFGPISGPNLIAEDAFEARGLVATDEGLLVSWYRSFNGQAPTPSAFARPLDALGEPAGARVTLLEPPAVLGPTLSPGPDGSFTAAVCRRFGADTSPTWLTLDARGQVVGDEHVVADAPEPCVTSGTDPQMVWTGQRRMLAFFNSVTLGRVFIERSAADGSDASTEALDLDVSIGSGPQWVLGDDRLALVLATLPEGISPARALTVRYFDLDGSPAEIPELELPVPTGLGLRDMRVAADDDRILILARGGSIGRRVRIQVDFDGNVITPLTEIEDEVVVGDVVRRPGGGYWAVVNVGDGPFELRQLDERGEVQVVYALADLGWWPQLVAHRGRVTVVYAVPTDQDLQQELYAVTLGCTP